MEALDPFPYCLIQVVNINSFDITIAISIFLSLVLIWISALLTGAENSFFTFNNSQLNNLQKENDYRNKLILRYLKDPQVILSTIVISNILVNTILIILLSFIINNLIEFPFQANITFLIQAAFIAFILIIFGELIPKSFAAKNPLKQARRSAIPLLLFYKILGPLGRIFASTSDLIAKRMAKIKQNITIDDLSNALNLTTDQITEDENILKGIVKFGNIDVKEIMRSRVDVVAVDLETKYNDLLKLITDSGHSRIPVYEETFDNIKGILYIKDLLPHLKEKNGFKWQDLLRPPHFVPENKKINDLLKEFQENKVHIAIVIDEYGGTNGIVTMEDILEEIVGEITDESDSEEFTHKQINENTYIFEGKTLINDFYKIVNIDDTYFDDVKGDADTIAGLILEITGEIPSLKQIIEYKNITFTIESVDKRRIKNIKVKID